MIVVHAQILRCVETRHVMAKKHVIRVQVTVGNALHLTLYVVIPFVKAQMVKAVVIAQPIVALVTHIVAMVLVNIITMKTVSYVQKIVVLVHHPQTLYVAMVHVIRMKIVVHAQVTVRVHVNFRRVLKEKYEMIQTYV